MYRLPIFVIYPIHFCLQMLNLGCWAILIFCLGIIKLVVPIESLQAQLMKLMHLFYFRFSIISVALIKLMNNVDIQIDINVPLSRQQWYLMIANHSSYLDIIMLIAFSSKRISPPKFFLKKELIWLPFVGLGAWALDMPFMRRYSKELVVKKPHLKGKDIATTRKSCQKFIYSPTSVINFVEGTRFTAAKAKTKQSPYSHLLRPKAGGVAFALAAMGEQFNHILDITITYPNNTGHPMNDMLSGRLTHIIIDVRVLPVEKDLIGDYVNDVNYQVSFQFWLNTLWEEKDKRMKELYAKFKS